MACLVGLVVLLLSAWALEPAASQDVVWYISPNASASSDIATCGRSLEEPCNSLQVVLDQSSLFDNTTGICRTSQGDSDGRTSTTLYLLEGAHVVPAVCLRGWDNLRIVGMGENVVVSSRLGAARGFFEFVDCTGVSLDNIQFDTGFVGKSTLFFDSSRDISIRECTFSLRVPNSRGIDMTGCAREISVSLCVFTGDTALASQQDNSIIALSVTHGCEMNSMNCVLPQDSFQLSVQSSTFVNVSSGGLPEDNYARVRSFGTALRVRFLKGSRNNIVTFDGLQVLGTINPSASAALVNFDSDSSDNRAVFTNSVFRNNRVRYGGGVASYFFSGPTDSQLEVTNCTFDSNEASFEGGGVFASFLSSDPSNTLHISRSTFTRNKAQVGAGVFVLNSPFWFSPRGLFNPISPPLVTVNLTDCTFVANRALQSEGVVSLLRVELYVDGVSLFSNSTGSALTLRLSLAFLSGHVTFLGNTADTGGAMAIREGSMIDVSRVTMGLFSHNKATYAGGAIFADSDSTSQLAVEFNHTLAQGLFGTCFIMFGNELSVSKTPVPQRFTFTGNTAVVEGQSIYSFSLRGCIVANFVPEETAQFLLIQNDGTVKYENASILDNIATGPTNLFFYGASTKCYKTVGNLTYLLPNCSHDLLNDTFSKLPNLQCGLSTFFSDLSSLYSPGTGLRPPVNKLYTPWATIGTSWNLKPSVSRTRCDESNPGNLVLSPAPGEQFDLTIQLADQLLNYILQIVYIDIVHDIDTPPGVLIQLNGIQFSYNDRVYFTPNRALSGLALVGLPGTAGQLRVVADSQVVDGTIELLIPFQLSQCPLGFFNPPGAGTVEEVNRLITTNYSTTQRIPPEQPLACQCVTEINSSLVSQISDSSLRCIRGYTLELNSLLWVGLIPMATTSSSLPAVDCPALSTNSSLEDGNYTQFIIDSRKRDADNGLQTSFNPVDVILYDNNIVPGGGAPVICFSSDNVSELVNYMPPGDLSLDICTRGYCRGDARSFWYAADVDYPCVENRHGVLCGQCRPGFAVTLYTTACKDCRDHIWQPIVALFATLLGGILLVLAAIALKLSISPTMDSLLFFIQTVLILLSVRADYANFPLFLSFFNPDFTFNLCITSSLTAFHRLILQYVTPVYILLLLLGILLLTKYTRVSKLLGKYSFLNGLWLLFLISYFNISNTSLELLHCRYITPLADSNVSYYVLSHDASVACFCGPHLPAGIVAITIAFLFVFPMPVYVFVAMFISKLKPVTDVYCSPYADNRRWWVVVSLGRRLLLVLVGVFVQTLWRHFALLFCIGLIQIVYVLTWPYKTHVDNYFGFFMGWMLLFVGVVSQPSLYLYTDPQVGVSFFFVLLMILVGVLLLALETILSRFRNQTVGKFFTTDVVSFFYSSKQRMTHLFSHKNVEINTQELVESTQSSVIPHQGTLDATSYREPLLDSIYASTAKDSSISSSQRDSAEKKGKQTRSRWSRKGIEHPSKVKEDDSLEAFPGAAQTSASTTLVGLPVGQDSGFAATSSLVLVNGGADL